MEALSGFVKRGAGLDRTEDLDAWVSEQRKSCAVRIEGIPFSRMRQWYFDRDGNVRHESGKFFTIEGLRIDDARSGRRHQPIINQNETGILGLLVKRFNGACHILLQAKMEPGNFGKIQVSPTVQATKSNYSRVHRGKSVAYVDYFLDPSRHGRLLFEQRQSEHGFKFFQKANNNIIVEIDEGHEVEVLPGFRWFSLDQVGYFLRRENEINMDARSALSCLSFAREPLAKGAVSAFLKRRPGLGLHERNFILSGACDEDAFMSTAGLEAWLEDKRKSSPYNLGFMPLGDLYGKGWVKSEREIYSDGYPDFRVGVFEISSGNREINEWHQPIISDGNRKLNGFLVKPINGVYHLLIQGCEEACSFHGAEIGPTLHNLGAGDPGRGTPFADYFTRPPRGSVLYDAVQSEEGGRFYHFLNRYMVVYTEDDIELPGDSYAWATLFQLKKMLEKTCSVNIEARTLVSCMTCGGACG